eukprot:COSAG06_NODE_13099_length_1293_cov_1.577889_2_plen_175_part_00
MPRARYCGWVSKQAWLSQVCSLCLEVRTHSPALGNRSRAEISRCVTCPGRSPQGRKANSGRRVTSASRPHPYRSLRSWRSEWMTTGRRPAHSIIVCLTTRVELFAPGCGPNLYDSILGMMMITFESLCSTAVVVLRRGGGGGGGGGASRASPRHLGECVCETKRACSPLLKTQV